MIVLLGAAAIVIDVAWFWSSSLRVQRAADAAALAGVVNLPGNVATAQADAIAEATKNGFQNGTGRVEVIPTQDLDNPRRLQVRIKAPIGTFFMHVFGISEMWADRTALAEFILPNPHGEPINYFGVYQGLPCKPGARSRVRTSRMRLSALRSRRRASSARSRDRAATARRVTPTRRTTTRARRSTASTTRAATSTRWRCHRPAGRSTYSTRRSARRPAARRWPPRDGRPLDQLRFGQRGRDLHLLPALGHPGTLANTLDDTRADTTTDDDLFTNELQVDKNAAYATASAAGGQNNNFADGNEPNLGSTPSCATGAISTRRSGGTGTTGGGRSRPVWRPARTASRS